MTTTRCHIDIDHVGFFGPSVTNLAAAFKRLGFAVVGPAELVAVNKPGESVSLSQQSAHVMFSRDYIELTTVAPQAGEQHHLARFLDRPAGLRLLILGTDDIDACWQNCVAAGLEPSPPRTAAREIAYGKKGTARFQWFSLAADKFPQALVAYAQHSTPEVVFQSVAAKHPNGATGLSRIIGYGDTVPANYEALVAAGGGTPFEAWPSDRLIETFGTDPGGDNPIAALGVAVTDCGIVERILTSNAIDYRKSNLGIAVVPAETGGAGLIFEEST